MQLPLRGIITPLATPLSPSNQGVPSLDPAGLERLIEHVLGGGVSGLFLLGTTGEFPSLSREVRQEIIRRTCTQVNGRVPVLAGITDTSLAETLHLADTAVDAGADAVVLAAPYYFLHSQEDLFRYVENLTGKLSLPLMLYNIPHLTKSSFEPETVRKAADLPGVIGVKDSTGDLNYLRKTVELLRDRPGFSVLVGPEEILIESMKIGAIGGVCGGSNLNPALFVNLYNAIVRGDAACASALQLQIQKSSDAIYHIGAPGSSYLRGLKAALALKGICHSEPAPPFFPFTEAEYAQLEQNYRSLNL